MELNKCRKIIWIMTIIFILINIFTLIFTIWTSKALAILSYICISIIIIYYIYILLIENDLDINILRKLREYPIKVTYCITFIFLLFTFFELILIVVNSSKFAIFWRNCPFIISDLDYNLHLNRRCELYNINNNSRYSYQYICSYDSSKDFKNDFSKKIESNNIICVPFNESIIENYYNYDVIILFTNEYKDEKKFFCSRTNIPEKNSSIKDKDCNNKKFRYMIATVILPYLRIICIFWPLLIIYIMPDTARENRNFFLRNFESISRQSTKISEISRGNEDFVKQNTQNIIIENKEEFKINTNIKNIETNNNINNIESNIENIELNLYNIKDENKSNSN